MAVRWIMQVAAGRAQHQVVAGLVSCRGIIRPSGRGPVSGLSACVVMEAPLAQVISLRTWEMSPELSFCSSSETPQQHA